MHWLVHAVVLLAAFAIGSLSGNSNIAQSVNGLILHILSDARTTAAVAAAFFALLSLLLQFVVGAKQAQVGVKQAEAATVSANAAMLSAEMNGHRAVASLRVKWIEELRNILAEFHSILVTNGLHPVPKTPS